jgi:DNA-binding GntR family transcriptional regulator
LNAKSAESADSAPENQLLSDVAYEKLLELFLSGELPPGTILRERRVAERLGISRTPVREAISRLAAEGLVTLQENLSPMVLKMPVQNFVEILKVRKLLEVEAAGLAAERGISSEAADGVREAINDLLLKPEPTTSEHWRVDGLVHGLISDASQNRLLASTVLDLMRRTHVFSTRRIPERLKPGAAEHLSIIDAVASRDVAGARRRMAEHIDNVRTAIVERILSIGQIR